MTQMRLKPLFIPACLSLVMHLLIMLVFAQLWDQIAHVSQPSSQARDKAIKVTTITQEQMQKYRTVGVKDGAKDFSSPMKIPPKKITPVTQTNNESVKLGQLGEVSTANVPSPPPPKEIPKPNATKPLADASSLRLMGDSQASVEVKTSRAQDRYQALRNMGIAESDAKQLAQSDFDVNFVPPEGVSEDELNSTEKMYYSFQKRTFESYVSSFLSTYNDMIRGMPRLRDPLLNDRHFLTARVIFDSEGNIMSLRILRSSPNDDIHRLFEKTLRNIRKLPNPPKDLLAKDGTFTIYYQLRVN